MQLGFVKSGTSDSTHSLKNWAGGKFIETFQFITLRPELNVELLSIGNILRDRQKASQDGSTACTKPHNWHKHKISS